MTRVVFLDFDGVLNSMSSFGLHGDLRLSPVHVSSLNKICDSGSAVVVVSSTWSLFRRIEELRDLLSEAGFTGKVVGTTPDIGPCRGKDIDQWLIDNRDVESFVILDDNGDMEPHIDRLVRTAFPTGLTEDHVDMALGHLGRMLDK